jgi:Uma2 family endonuclease
MSASTQNSINVHYKTAADWLHDLGDVPPERILFDPLPGTATEADLLHKVEVEKQLCELVDGTLVEKAMGLIESLIASRLIEALLSFVRPRRLGAVSGEAGTLRLGKGLVRLPDVAFIAAEKFRGHLPLESIPSIAPDLAVEILSKSSTRREIERKIAEYFEAGTRLVWIIDPETRTAIAHRSLNVRQAIAEDGTLDGDDVLPGFHISLAELFKAADEMINPNG